MKKTRKREREWERERGRMKELIWFVIKPQDVRSYTRKVQFLRSVRFFNSLFFCHSIPIHGHICYIEFQRQICACFIFNKRVLYFQGENVNLKGPCKSTKKKKFQFKFALMEITSNYVKSGLVHHQIFWAWQNCYRVEQMKKNNFLFWQ